MCNVLHIVYIRICIYVILKRSKQNKNFIVLVYMTIKLLNLEYCNSCLFFVVWLLCLLWTTVYYTFHISIPEIIKVLLFQTLCSLQPCVHMQYSKCKIILLCLSVSHSFLLLWYKPCRHINYFFFNCKPITFFLYYSIIRICF